MDRLDVAARRAGPVHFEADRLDVAGTPGAAPIEADRLDVAARRAGPVHFVRDGQAATSGDGAAGVLEERSTLLAPQPVQR